MKLTLFILGILIILGALIFSLYWAIGEHKNKALVIPLCVLAMLVGISFTFHERAIEITFKGVGKIKAAAKQATMDAQAIAEIKERIEAQSATIDLVAKSAADAEEKIKELESITELSKVALEARSDNRHAFDKLVLWGENQKSAFWELAANTVIKIRAEFNGPIDPGNQKIKWPENINPLRLSIKQIRDEYNKSLPLYHADFVKHINKNTVIPKKEKMQFYIDILKEDGSLTATYYAGKYFINEADDDALKWSPFWTTPLLDWWKQNKDKIK